MSCECLGVRLKNGGGGSGCVENLCWEDGWLGGAVGGAVGLAPRKKAKGKFLKKRKRYNRITSAHSIISPSPPRDEITLATPVVVELISLDVALPMLPTKCSARSPTPLRMS